MTDRDELSARLIVVHEDPQVRTAIQRILRTAGYEVEQMASAAPLRDRIAALGRPVCILLNVHTSGVDGVAVLRNLVGTGLPVRVIAIAEHAAVASAVRAMKAGASDYLQKPFSRETLLPAVSEALHSLHEEHRLGASAPEIMARLARLTTRERDVMEKLVDGHTNKQIARDLGISPRTVEVYRKGVMRKMEADNLTILLRMALVAGFKR